MLDATTKRRIDNCRDILVGKVPDPKSQIEQITIALIYKFMDDMDREAIELGGKRQFFGKDYEKYAWPELFNKELSGENRVKLYAEAIEKMDENPGIPQLFRDIFKNAYLPYRDPETLREFLKYINEFTYDHSEKLGDAFEYLLSVLGSQGDAGQFRTPRHIIDFIVELLAPQKNEVILDPACGTAGFLISAYKYILKNNSTNFNATTDAPAFMQHYGNEEIKHYSGDKLTPDQRKKLANNLNGYDISPDMVRLSLVNLYLHGLPEPHIYEYDTLTNEERWNEKADVILANPPFMTPKGGIRPHKKFGVQANKAEVLFTDYIAEHLNSNGRAGIVVPNGIVATSQTAYKQLRKMLVQESLIAVISLPAGVFQPYSGVKTSVLILDKRLAKKSQHILFLKIENDGFDLGAQRREIDYNDLPLALQTLKAFKECLNNDKAFEDLPNLATLVEKEIVLGNKDVVLSAERYVAGKLAITEFEIKPLSEFVIFTQTGLVRNKGEQNEEFQYPYLKMDGITYDGQLQLNKTVNVNATKDEFEKYNLKKGDFLYNTRNTPDLVGKSTVFNGEENKYLFNNNIMRVRFDSRLNPFFLNYVINTSQYKNELKKFVDGTTSVAAIYPKNYFSIEIPLPPLEIQQQIVAEIEGYKKIIDGAKQVVNNYKPTISIDPDWEMVELGEVCKPEYGFTETAKEKGNARFIRITDIGSDGKLKDTDPKYVELTKEAKQSIVVKDDILVARTGATYGKTMIFNEDYPAVFASFLIRLNFDKTKIYPKYYWAFAQSENYIQQAARLMTGGGQPQFNGNAIVKIQIPVPPIEEQQTIVQAIEEEMQLVNANKRLIEIFEQKIKDRIARVWGVEESEENVYPEVEIPVAMAAEV